MVQISNVKFEQDKWCLCCKMFADDVKEIKISVGTNFANGMTFCLCKKCRENLVEVLKDE